MTINMNYILTFITIITLSINCSIESPTISPVYPNESTTANVPNCCQVFNSSGIHNVPDSVISLAEDYVDAANFLDETTTYSELHVTTCVPCNATSTVHEDPHPWISLTVQIILILVMMTILLFILFYTPSKSF